MQEQRYWVDFRAVKAAAPMSAVLQRYRVKLKKQPGDELCGRCPIHQGEGADSFQVNLFKNSFHCFSCGKRGNVLDFVAAMERCSVKDSVIKLAVWFNVQSSEEERRAAALLERAATEVAERYISRGEELPAHVVAVLEHTAGAGRLYGRKNLWGGAGARTGAGALLNPTPTCRNHRPQT